MMILGVPGAFTRRLTSLLAKLGSPRTGGYWVGGQTHARHSNFISRHAGSQAFSGEKK